MTRTSESRSRRVRRKLRGAGPFLLALSVVAMVLGRAPASADLDDETAEATQPVVEASPPTVEETPVVVETAAAVPDAAELAERLHLGTRLMALGVMRLPPRADVVEAVAGEAPSHLLWPVQGGNFGRGFGYTRAGRPELAHLGVDINAPEGTPVQAAADGLVVYAGDAIDGFGNFIVMVHANGWGTSYAHNSQIQVQVGQQVHRGDQIALVGQTGLAHGPHVHFEFYQHGHPSDPTPLFEQGPPHVQRMVEHAALEARLHPRRHH